MVSSRVPTTQPPYRSCHLYAGCRSDSKQVTSELIPYSLHKHGFDITHCISTHHQWFPYGHLLYGYLTVHHCLLNVSFTTLTLSGESSIHRFATSSCKAIARDLLSSVSQLRMCDNHTTFSRRTASVQATLVILWGRGRRQHYSSNLFDILLDCRKLLSTLNVELYQIFTYF